MYFCVGCVRGERVSQSVSQSPRWTAKDETHRHVLPRLDLLDALADHLEAVARLVDQFVHPLAHARGVAARAQVPDLAVEPLVVAVELEELVHEVLRQPLEVGVVGVGAACAAAAPRLEGGELVEGHGSGVARKPGTINEIASDVEGATALVMALERTVFSFGRWMGWSD